MKIWLLLSICLLPIAAVRADEASTSTCAGQTTLEMRACASRSLEQSTRQLQSTLPRPLWRQWQQSSNAVCARANALYQDGTIYPQLLMDCVNQLNRALLKEFQSLEGPR